MNNLMFSGLGFKVLGAGFAQELHRGNAESNGKPKVLNYLKGQEDVVSRLVNNWENWVIL